MIASALYNEWLVSKEDVARFLWSQNWWTNSTEEDRLNTIESVWKRLWQIQPKEEEAKPDPSIAEQILTDTSGQIYWKTTAEEGEPSEWINTLADANSVFRAMEEARVKNLQELISMNPSDIAEMMVSGLSPFSETTMRDAQKYYPEFVAKIEAERKKKLWQQNVNAIASWWEMVTATNWQSQANDEIANFATSNATSTKSAAEINQDVHNALAENQTANEANETMATIEEDMAILKNRLKNLRQEANAAFKWDVPDYMVNAYINNKAQEIQNQMSILEDRYNAAYDRYKTQLANTQREKEYELKQQQLQLQKDELALKRYQVENSLSTTTPTNTWTSTKNEWDSYEVTTLSDEEVSAAVDRLRDMYDNWQLGNAQCAAWIQKYYLPMLGINLPNISSIENKKKLINEWDGYTPKRGDLIILKGSKAEYWHIWIVLSVKKDWTVEYMDWNGSLNKDGTWTEKVGIHGISWSSSSILWFRNVNKDQSSVWTSSLYNTERSDYDYTAFETFLDGSTSAANRKQIAEEYGVDVSTMRKMATYALETRNNIKNTSSDGTSSSWWEVWKNRFWKEYDLSSYSEWNSLSNEEKEIVKWILDYREDPTTLAKWWTENGTRNYRIRAAAVALWWDDYNVTNYSEAHKLVNKWNLATQSWWELSRNATAMDALKDLYEIYYSSALRYNDPSKPANAIVNRAMNNLFWADYTAAFNAAKEVAASEVAWALKGNASPTDPEIERQLNLLSYNMSPAQFNATLEYVAKGMFNKMASEAQYYEELTGRKPYNIYNEKYWLPDWISQITWINMGDYFSNATSYSNRSAEIAWNTNTWPSNNAPSWWNSWSNGGNSGRAWLY